MFFLTEDKLCPNHGEWPTTLGGQEASIPCPDGYSGNIIETHLALHPGTKSLAMFPKQL